MIRIFVYGTLMRGCCNHDGYLAGKNSLGSATLNGYGLYNLGFFPGIIREVGERVQGEVYEIDVSTLARLDELEDNGEWYTRTIEKAEFPDGTAVEAYVYVWNGLVRRANRIPFDHQPWSDDMGRWRTR